MMRYYVDRRGIRYHILCGTGTRSLGSFFSKTRALRFAGELQTAFYDGQFYENELRRTA